MPTLSKRAVMLALLPVLSLGACGQPEPIVSTPPAEWFEPVAEPAVPAGDTDAEVAGYLVDLIDALRAANGRLLRLKDWREGFGGQP